MLKNFNFNRNANNLYFKYKEDDNINEDKQLLSNEFNARENAMIIIDEYNNGELSVGRYAYKLISETYLNLVSQAQSGMRLCVEGHILDVKLGSARKVPNKNNYLNGYRIGKYAINFQQDLPTILGNYDENANLTIVTDGFLIQEQLDNPGYQSGTVVYNGAFKDITQEGLNILEVCLKFSALNYDLFLDKQLLETFSQTIKHLGISLNDLPLLDDKNHKI